MNKENNPPAFPTIREYQNGAGTGQEHIEGMSLRDYFAASERIPWNVVIDYLDNVRPESKNAHPVSLIMQIRARWKGQAADAMLLERNKETK